MKYQKKISHYNSNFDIILPIIPYKGNCSLECASKPLYEITLDYNDKITLDYNDNFPLNPIHLIACSNGCRIASWIECKFRDIKYKYSIKENVKSKLKWNKIL